MVLRHVSILVAGRFEDETVVRFAKVVHCKERREDICYSRSEKLLVISVACNELALPFIRDLISTGIGV